MEARQSAEKLRQERKTYRETRRRTAVNMNVSCYRHSYSVCLRTLVYDISLERVNFCFLCILFNIRATE
jgi:hypothetical protein